MNFHGLSDDQIFEKVAGEPAAMRFEGLMHMGMNRTFEKIDEAISFYESALELATTEEMLEMRFVAVRFLVNALRLAGRQQEGIDLLKKELSDDEAAKVSDDEIGRAMLEYAQTLAEMGLPEAAIQKLEDAAPFFTASDANCTLADYYNRVSDALFDQGMHQFSANLAQRARGFSADCGHTAATGKSFYLMARAYEAMHMFDDALQCYKEADTLLSYASEGDDELFSRLATARILWLRKDYDKSVQVLQELREFSHNLHYASQELYPRIEHMLGRCYFGQGKFDQAAAKFYKARTLLRAMAQNPFAALAEAEGALAQLAMGNVADAITAAETAMRWFNEKRTVVTGFWVRLAYGKVMNATGNHDAALAVLSDHAAYEINTDFAPHVEYRIELAVAEANAGDAQAAAATAGVVLEFFDHTLSNHDRGRLQVVMTEAAAARNDLPEALRCIALAIKSYAADFNSFEVERLTERLLQIAAGEANRANNEVLDGL